MNRLSVAILIAFALLCAANVTSQSATKERWEYQVIHHDPLGMPLMDSLNTAGRAGWELAGVLNSGMSQQGTPGAYNLLMKRRLP